MSSRILNMQEVAEMRARFIMDLPLYVPPKPPGPRGRPMLKVNKWLATQHLDRGIALCHLQGEYERRYERETKYILAAPRSSMEKAIKSERMRRERKDL